ncbi:uncharacterized protein LOC121387570 [Gigantopelta aegis]|uniref:uncharacterized protein LOC121387570 n=1 Tax=Gigantopelta aegis TaxID=1735272 RepID=UPI001B88DC75|nr:uncharacterized protein LOC121387570 [Gigantopelta aegis]
MARRLSEADMVDALNASGKYNIEYKGTITSIPSLKKESYVLNMPHMGGSDSQRGQHLTSSTYIPKISPFSGDDPPQKGDSSFMEWCFEVRCLMTDPEMHPPMVLQAVRKSLRGTARSMLIPLGERATVTDIISKLDILFGDVLTNGMIMQEFFNASQKSEESVTAFGCRLETMLQAAINCSDLDRHSKNDLLRHKFWTPLNCEKLKSQTRHKYDTIREYDDLLREIRKVEKELSMTTATNMSNKRVHQQAMPTVGVDKVCALESQFDRKLENLKRKLDKKNR